MLLLSTKLGLRAYIPATLTEGVFPAMALLAGMQLDVFTTLKDGSKTTDEVAAVLGVGPVKLAPFLYALVAAGLLTVEEDRFSNTAEAGEFLVKGLPGYRAGMHIF